MARFGILLVALIAITGWILSLVYKTAADRHAILVSAVIAVVVQLAAFGLVELMRRSNAMLAGWGMGIALRMISLILYALVFTKALGLPLNAALMSFAVFLFVSMLLESILIAYAS
jgi:hypothetical protein